MKRFELSAAAIQRALVAAGAAALAAVACSTSTAAPSGGQFSGLSGLAVTSAGDRDLLFVASTGSDDLRAINLCPAGNLLDGGVVTLADGGSGTCPASEDLQFVPGPVRVVPAEIQTSDRPVRLAGARLLSAGGGASNGAVLVAGAESALRVVDAKNLIDAENHLAPGIAPLRVPLDAPAVDVVAANPLGAGNVETGAVAVRAFAATQKSSTAPAELLVLDVRLDPATGNVQVPTVLQSCSLGAVVPRRLAVAAGVDSSIYVADGAGDGAIRVDVASIPAAPPAGTAPAACAVALKIGAGGHPLRSLAASPPYYQAGPADAAGNATVVTHPAGELVAGVTDDGGVLFMRTSDGAVLPVPPFAVQEAGHPAMEPLRVAGSGVPLPLRDVSFMVPPPPNPPACVGCTAVIVGGYSPTAVSKTFDLVAVASSNDGGIYFFAPLERRFLSDTRDGTGGIAVPLAQVTQQAVLAPLSTDPNAPAIPVSPSVNSGVTPQARWKLQFHQPIPGLERRGGTMTSPGSGKLLFTTTPADLGRWASSPVTALSPGDVVALILAPNQQLCPDLASETQLRIELPITRVNADSLELSTVPDAPGVPGFHPSTDPAAKCFPFGAIAEVRAAGSKPWIVTQNSEVKGRAGRNVPFSLPGLRFDYPLAYNDPANPLPPPVDDTSVAFTVTGNDPVAGSTLIFYTSAGFIPTVAHDTTLTQGIGENVLVYNSSRYRNLLFSSISGANVLLKADPAQLNVVGGIVSFR